MFVVKKSILIGKKTNYYYLFGINSFFFKFFFNKKAEILEIKNKFKKLKNKKIQKANKIKI